MTRYKNHVTIEKEGYKVTIARTKISGNGTKSLNIITTPKSTKGQDITKGANTPRILDILMKPERRITINGYLVTDIDGPTTKLTAVATSGANTITVQNTDSFPTTGTLTLNGDTVDYTGKSTTTFTGCSGITTIHGNGDMIASNFDTNSDASDKLDDLSTIFYGGGTFTINVNGVEYTANSDKFEYSEDASDHIQITNYDITITVVIGENLGGSS